MHLALTLDRVLVEQFPRLCRREVAIALIGPRALLAHCKDALIKYDPKHKIVIIIVEQSTEMVKKLGSRFRELVFLARGSITQPRACFYDHPCNYPLTYRPK